MSDRKPPPTTPPKVGRKNLVSRFSSSALDLLFPLHCLACGLGGKLICQACTEKLPRLASPFCKVCAQPGTTWCERCATLPLAVDGLRAPFLMEGAVREAVHALKYRDPRAIARELGSLLASYVLTHRVVGDVIVPVPLHPKRLRRRGYNQSALLGKELGKLVGLPTNERLLARVRNTAPQVELVDSTERQGNVAGSFRCVADVRGQAILLVDDVITTGSTMAACAAALKAAGASSVWGLALAREA